MLTVGDGLVTMIPSLLVSMAGGMVVTRASSESSLGRPGHASCFRRGVRCLWRPAVMVALAADSRAAQVLLPAPGRLMGLLAWRLPGRRAGSSGGKDRRPRQAGRGERPRQRQEAGSRSARRPAQAGRTQPGSRLRAGAAGRHAAGRPIAGADAALRSNLAQQLGFIVPPVHITDNARLKPREYVISLRGVEIARWEMHEDRCWPSARRPRRRRWRARHPRAGLWRGALDCARLAEQALAAGYAVVDQTSVLATHLAEVIKQHAAELLTRQETKRLLDRLAESHPKLVEELVPKLLSLGEVQKVLQQLLREQVSIRDLADHSRDPARHRRRQTRIRCCWWKRCARRWAGRWCGRCWPKTAACAWLRSTAPSRKSSAAPSAPAGRPGQPRLQPSLVRRLLEGLRRLAGEQAAVTSPVLLCSTPARFHLKRLLEPFMPKLVVLSPGEIPPAVSVQSVGVLR